MGGQKGLQLEINNLQDSELLQNCTEFAGTKVTVQPHKILNYSKGVVKSVELRGFTPDDIIQNVDGVTNAFNCTRWKNRNKIKTDTWIIKFNSPIPKKQSSSMDTQSSKYRNL